MLKIDFVVNPSNSLSGFNNGDVIFVGEKSRVELNSMVILSASHLMDELKRWHEKSTKILEFNALDSGEFVKFVRNSEDVTLWARGREIGTENIYTFFVSILQATSKLQETFVSKLSREDIGRKDLEESAIEFQDFVKKM